MKALFHSRGKIENTQGPAAAAFNEIGQMIRFVMALAGVSVPSLGSKKSNSRPPEIDPSASNEPDESPVPRPKFS